MEIQVRHQPYYPERSMYYLAGMYREQLNAGQDFQELRPCYGVHFLVSDLFSKEEEKSWYNHYRMMNVKNHRVLSTHWQLYFVELKKFHKAIPTASGMAQRSEVYGKRLERIPCKIKMRYSGIE
ncbi:hypothetical protein GMMP15_850018 [Candidatus Magnetomoraceae bacterium gMMP-15]